MASTDVEVHGSAAGGGRRREMKGRGTEEFFGLFQKIGQKIVKKFQLSPEKD